MLGSKDLIFWRPEVRESYETTFSSVTAGNGSVDGVAQAITKKYSTTIPVRPQFSNHGSRGKGANIFDKGGPKTFIAQSIADTDGPSGETGWWLLQTAVKQGSSKNIFLELKDIESSSPPLFGLGSVLMI